MDTLLIIEIFGWLGGFFLAICALPQLIKTVKTRDFRGLSISYILIWFFGEIFTLLYIFTISFRWPLLFNHGINFFISGIILLMYYLKKSPE